MWKRGACVLLVAGCASSTPALERSRIREIRSTGPMTGAPVASGDCSQLSWPLDGVLSSPFGRRDGRPHEGIDIAVPEGTEVRAACDGVVAYSGDELRGYGRLIILKHALSISTVYAHNRKLLVREGQAVARGEVIALSGQTGHATAPHLHFEVRLSTRPTDPMPYLGATRMSDKMPAAKPAKDPVGESRIRLLSGP